eukprot:TRINITY_DN6812_c0_g1_i11.p1 TRINITY_DN6812_c0_g1~~TRINITY_DN6812_c0_g1_i11.p1  ORF type:complete len:253 (-),score=45.20 TRINITY_DN6812_c0_g1_i11:280-1038(-)
MQIPEACRTEKRNKVSNQNNRDPQTWGKMVLGMGCQFWVFLREFKSVSVFDLSRQRGYHTEMKTWGPKIELSFRMQYGRLSTYDQVDLYSLPEKIRVMKGFEVALGGLIFPVYSRILFSVEEHSFPVKDEQLNLPSETQPGVHLGTQAGTQSGIQSELQPRLQLGSQPGTQPGPQPGLQTGTQPGPQPGVQPESRPGTQAGLQPGLQPEAQPQPPQKKKKKSSSSTNPFAVGWVWISYRSWLQKNPIRLCRG